MSAIVLDASAGVEIAFQTPVGQQLQAKIPTGSTTWVPEHYFVEVAGVLRRAEINGRQGAALEDEALARSLRDPRDWPVVACALALSAGVWTNDNDFLGTGVATWTTETLHAWLGRNVDD